MTGSLQPFGYTGYQYDKTAGTYYAQAREYRAEIGRFAAVDTIKGFTMAPYTLNEYGYCWGNPMMLVDRNGRIPVYSENELYVGAVTGEPLSVDTNLQEPALCAGAANVIEDNTFSINNENGLGYDVECSDTEKIDIGDGTYITLPDPNIQYCEIERNKGATMTIKLAMGFNCFGGFAGDVDLSFDMHGNIALQASQARFIDERYNTRNIGIIDGGFAGQLQFTNADTVFDLNGNAEYVGFTAGAGPYGGIDAIALPNTNGKYDSIDGFQLQAGLGVGVDAHVTRSYTETFGYLNVFDVRRKC